jgi:hypothetical protein
VQHGGCLSSETGTNHPSGTTDFASVFTCFSGDRVVRVVKGQCFGIDIVY